MFRWFKELRNPSLKCERIGHKSITVSRTGMVRSDYYVCDRVTQEKQVCKCCNMELSTWEEVDRTGISSWTAPTSVMEKFRKTGEYWIDY